MPILKSSLKDLRRTAKRRERNRERRTALRTALKKVRAGAASRNLEAARAALRVAIPALDKAVAAGILHKNAAGRHKSRLTRLVDALTTPGPAS